MIRFDDNTHTYYIGDKKIPNVTTVLEPIGSYAGIPQYILHNASLRGNYVHKACEMFLWGTLDEDSLADEHIPYIEAFKRFMTESGFRPEFIEERVYHKSLMYAGTMDLGGILPAMGRAKKDRLVLIDIKTTFRLLPSVGPQIAAYFDAWNSSKIKSERFQDRYGLRLKPNGDYQLMPYSSPMDMNVFRSCLVVYNFTIGNNQ